MANYDSVKGVSYARYEDDNPDPVLSQNDAEIDEMYYEQKRGRINLTIETVDGYLSIEIPIHARLDFNDFKHSLPEIDA